MEYVGFWKRLGAMLVDLLLFIPAMALYFLLLTHSPQAYVAVTLLMFLFSLFFYIYLVKEYEGTPGKLVAGIKIIQQDGSRITYREAILRSAIWLVPWTIYTFGLIYARLDSPPVELSSMSTFELLGYLEKKAWLVTAINDIAGAIWVFGGIVFILANPKKRAIHDFIAGTVVVKNS